MITAILSLWIGLSAVAEVIPSFESQFAKVSPDLVATSQMNLEHLRAQMIARRRYSVYADRARALAERVSRELVLTHGTKVPRARAILRSGQFLSYQEAVRRAVVKPDALQLTTSERTDGVIGEQDVIFLALGGPSFDNFYGNVVFEFDREPVLERGYFTFDSFGHGWHGEFEDSPEVFAFKMQDYRAILFQGLATFREVLTLAAANWLWIADDPSFVRAARDAQGRLDAEVRRAADERRRGVETHFSSSITYDFDGCPALVGLSQVASATCAEYNQTIGRDSSLRLGKYQWLFNLAQVGIDKDLADRVLASAFLSPAYADTHHPLLSRDFEGYWEVKVPRELPLDFLKGLRLKRTKMTADELTGLLEDARAFAANTRRTIRVEETGDSVRVTFGK